MGHRVRYAVLGLVIAALGMTVAITSVRGAAPASQITLAGSSNETTIYACVTRWRTFFDVSVGKAPTCPKHSYEVQWQAVPSSPSPSPSPTPPSPSPTTTSPSPSPSPTGPSQTPPGTPCVTAALGGNCGPYDYPGISDSNGYNTYVANNMWGCGPIQPGNPGAACGAQTVTAVNPGNWNVVSDQAAGNTAVLTYPDIQQVFTLTSDTDPAISSFSAITSTFAENMHATSGTDAEAGYDLWLSGTSGPDEVMIWVDNAGRGSGGATQIGTATIGGQAFTVYQYGGSSGEVIFSLNQNEQSGAVDILSTLRWLQGKGLVSATAGIGQVDFGWEICSTGGHPETFSVSGYTLDSTCANGAHCTV